MEALFLKLLDMSVSGSWLILAVIATRLLLRNAPPIRKPCWIAVGSAEASRPVRLRSGKRASKQG